MEDNYYKKGKDGGSGAGAGPSRAHSYQSSTNLKGRKQTQHNSRHHASSSQTLKATLNDLGKGRIVESSKSGFAN